MAEETEIKAIIPSEMLEVDRQRYYHFIIQNNIRFTKDPVDGMYVAHVKLMNKDDDKVNQKRNMNLSPESSSARRGSRPPEEMNRLLQTMNTADQLAGYSCYASFSALINSRRNLRPIKKALPLIMKLIEEIYDARQTHDILEAQQKELEESKKENELAKSKSSIKDPEDDETESSASEEESESQRRFRNIDKSPKKHLSNIFPIFVRDFFSRRYGLNSLVEQTCWDLLYNVHGYRKQFLEIEIFGRFLEEYYDSDDLIFYLFVRNFLEQKLQDTMKEGFSFRNRWNVSSRGKQRFPDPIMFSFTKCQLYAKELFGSEDNPLYQSFIKLIEKYCKPPSKKSTGTEKEISMTVFMHLALAQYHELQPEPDESVLDETTMKKNLTRDEQERNYQAALEEYEARMKELGEEEEEENEEEEEYYYDPNKINEKEEKYRKSVGQISINELN